MYTRKNQLLTLSHGEQLHKLSKNNKLSKEHKKINKELLLILEISLQE
jgi:hypothetical protein